MDDEIDHSSGATTGLPGMRTWRAVYFVVFGTFVLWIVLLTMLTRFFS